MINCPRCGTGVQVPPLGQPLKLQKNQFSDEELNAPFKPLRDDDEASPMRSLFLVTGAAAFVGGVLITLIVVWMVLPAREPQIAGPRTTTNPSIPSATTPAATAVNNGEPAAATTSAPMASQPSTTVVSTPEPAVPAEKKTVEVAEAPLKPPPMDPMKTPREKSRTKEPAAAPLPADDIPRIALQLPPPGEFQHSFKIDQADVGEEYSRIVLQTTGEESDPKVNAFFLSNKVLGKSMETVTFAFATNSDTWEFVEFHDVKFVIDGEPLELDESQHGGTTLKSGGVVELITVSVELDVFLKIIQASTVEVSVGIIDFQLTPTQLEALRDLASRIPDGETTPGNYLISHAKE